MRAEAGSPLLSTLCRLRTVEDEDGVRVQRSAIGEDPCSDSQSGGPLYFDGAHHEEEEEDHHSTCSGSVTTAEGPQVLCMQYDDSRLVLGRRDGSVLEMAFDTRPRASIFQSRPRLGPFLEPFAIPYWVK